MGSKNIRMFYLVQLGSLECLVIFDQKGYFKYFRGNLAEGIRLFNKAIPLAKSITELSHYCSLRDAAVAQVKVVKRLGISLPPGGTV